MSCHDAWPWAAREERHTESFKKSLGERQLEFGEGRLVSPQQPPEANKSKVKSWTQRPSDGNGALPPQRQRNPSGGLGIASQPLTLDPRRFSSSLWIDTGEPFLGLDFVLDLSILLFGGWPSRCKITSRRHAGPRFEVVGLWFNFWMRWPVAARHECDGC